MSVLLIAPPADLGRVVVERLIAQDDEVRVVEPCEDRVEGWRDLGAFVAAGQVNEDLVERAAHNVRTIVVFASSLISDVVASAQLAGVGRVVLVAERTRADDVDELAGSGLEFVVIVTGRLRRRTLNRVAEAIDAADDLPGEPRATVDVRDRGAASRLRISAEYEKPTP
jgi:hypothetical protein